ncbi:MAG TPA: PHP domain-containing protein [Dissulfurispiraceae bacterium]|nr:PHP domain-containing protein [Dissulfurispiraceae bacterium]
MDLHVHSLYSEDNCADPEEMVLRAIELKLNGLAFTEHYSYAASGHIEALKEKFHGKVRIFRGVEYSSAEGHCLIFGADTDILLSKYMPVGEVSRIVNEAGGVIIPSHPYRKGSSLEDLILTVQGICALEGHNGCNMPSYNARAVQAAKKRNLPYTGGSDAHSPGEVGSCYTEFDDELTDDNFIHLLRRGLYKGVDMRHVVITIPSPGENK